MGYHVVGPDNALYGPAEIEQLNTWILEGRIRPTTLLIEEGRQAKIAAAMVKGLVWPEGVNFVAETKQPELRADLERSTLWWCFGAGVGLACCYSHVGAAAALLGLILSFRFRSIAAKDKRAFGIAFGILTLLHIGTVVYIHSTVLQTANAFGPTGSNLKIISRIFQSFGR